VTNKFLVSNDGLHRTVTLVWALRPKICDVHQKSSYVHQKPSGVHQKASDEDYIGMVSLLVQFVF
ncbi:MAG: hypothetical protein ACI37N_00175, partial [Prevotella sp.]